MTLTTTKSIPQANVSLNNPQARKIPAWRALVHQAQQLNRLGINVIPQDGHKKPLVKWKSDPDWTQHRQTLPNVNVMPWSRARRIAVICGQVSGDLVCVDFDHQGRAAVDQFLTALDLPLDYPWCEPTPGGGWHVYVTCHDFTPPDDHRGGKVDRPDVTEGHIELRFEGVLTTLYLEELPHEPPATVDGQPLVTAYALVTQPPEPKPAPAPKPYSAPDLPPDSSELLEVERRTRAAIANTLIKRGGKPGYYDCPLEHGHEGKDFLFDPEPGKPIGGCQGKHAGQLTRWVDLAEQVGIDVGQIAREVAAERRPTAYQRAKQLPTLARTATRFPLGLPVTLWRRLINIHQKIKNRFQRQTPGALVWAVWHELAALLPGDQPFTAGQFQIATQQIGRNLSRATVESGLIMLAAWGIGEFCEFCDLPTSIQDIVRLQKSQNSKAGRPGQYFRFFPIDQQIAHFARHYAYLTREWTFAGAPSDMQPEYGDDPLEGELIAVLDTARQPVYEAHAAARESAQAKLDQQLESLAAAIDRIAAGGYIPVDLPPGELPNAAVLVKAMHKAGLEAAGGQREKAYLAQFDLGVSRATLSRIRTANHALTLPREGRIPIDQVTDYQRDHGLVLAEHADGTATVRLPSAEKFVDQATEHEIAAHADVCQRQREIRARAKSHESQFAAEPRPAMPDTIPAAYSDQHLLEQFNFTPGADTIPRYDQETGEIYAPGHLWRLLAAKLTAQGELDHKGANMPNVAYSEPRESVLEGEDRAVGEGGEPGDLLRIVETFTDGEPPALAAHDLPRLNRAQTVTGKPGSDRDRIGIGCEPDHAANCGRTAGKVRAESGVNAGQSQGEVGAVQHPARPFQHPALASLNAKTPPIVAYIDGLPYTAVMLERRAGKLYIPPSAVMFKCRQCYDLSYTSAQSAHEYDRKGGELGELFRAFDALLKWERKAGYR